jgi:pyruvate dehydrogenase E2 component (dihydrolipoamide acetyltransferase)
VVAPAKVDDVAIDEFIAAFKPALTSLESQAAEPGQQQPEPTIASQDSVRKRTRVSPSAAQRARELGVEISKVQSSGRRVSPEDVERHARRYKDSEIGDVEDAVYEAIPMSATRKSIARKLVSAIQEIPHFYLSIDIFMDAALAYREEINRQNTQEVSINDIVLRAAVLALQSVPDINIHVVQDEIRRFRQINLAIAVATEAGLITPVIQQAGTLTVVELAKEAAALSERARNSALTIAEVENGTFTVSNLGMYGISGFQAIINPPQGAILAVGACDNRVISGADGIRSGRVMGATLSCDHRAIDGALGAQFLSKFKAILERPEDL